MPDADLARRYPDGLPLAGTSGAAMDLAGLCDELAGVRDQGYAVNWEETAGGVCAVAVALGDTAGQPLAGFGVAAPSSRIGEPAALRTLVPAVLRAAALVHERLHVPS